jgi:RimJ/RimL family protein N-acetyltransferase
MTVLHTSRLDLIPMTLAHVEAVMLERRADLARMAEAALPDGWPSRTLVTRAYHSIERIRANPADRLWGDRLVIVREGVRRVIGSVVFHGRPDAEGAVEIAYGIEPGSQGQGYASEATQACVQWAFAQPEVQRVTAVTTPWHRASIRVLERLGMRVVGSREHETMGELLLYVVER